MIRNLEFLVCFLWVLIDDVETKQIATSALNWNSDYKELMVMEPTRPFPDLKNQVKYESNNEEEWWLPVRKQ